MNLSEYRQMVDVDLNINQTDLDTESLRTPQLHSKYLNFLSDEKLILSKLDGEYRVIKKYKWLYYTGKLSQEELEQFEWQPFQLSVLKTDIDKFMDADEDIQKIYSRMQYRKTVVDYLDSIIKIISNRQWNIRAAIDWLKFTNGQ
jgi:hypothetical protein|tara:strand:- start:642 stop:1076 length:435 start_codon:yes stop_codon:yes gene_type:complete